jgi:hypothetical protein
MAAKIYTNPNMVIDASSDFGPDEIMDYIGQFEQMRTAKSADARAERMAALQEANIKYTQKITEQTSNQKNALTQWSSYGLDHKAASNPDYNIAFSAKLPSLSEQWEGYSASSLSNGIAAPDYMTFQQNVVGQNAAYMNTIIGRFNLEYDRMKRDNPNASEESIMNELKLNYNADQVYANFSQVAATPGGKDLMTPLKYIPATVDEPFWKDALSVVYEPGIEGRGAKLRGGPTAALIAGAPTVYGAYKAYGTVKEGSAEYLKAAEKAWDKKGNAKEYEKTYGEKKIKSGDSRKKGAKFDASSKVAKHARNTGLSKTYLGKAAKWAKGKVTPKGAKPSVKGFVKGAAPYVAPGAGRMVGEAIAGDTGGDIGQTLGTGYLLNKAAKPAGKSFVSYLASKAPSMAAKMGVMAMADSPALPIGDILALGWSAVEVYKLYQAWSEEN